MPAARRIEQIIADFVQATEQGKTVERDKLLASHPEFARELGEFFQIHDRFVLAAATARFEPAETATLIGQPEEIAQPVPDSLLGANPPRFLGDYEILGEIDRGGMGVVYKARHRTLGRTVALKLIRSGELASEEEIRRFRSEAEAAAALNHPGIVPIHEVGMLQGLVFYTMAFIEGRSLMELASGGPMDPMEAARIIHKLCAAVEHAHQAGVYHRDIKPANVLIDDSGQPILIDFGLAKISHRDSGLTATGQILGTPAYMAPEHASGKAKETTPASDVYSLGGVLYCLCAGQPPFSGPTAVDVLLQVLDREPPAPSKLNRRVTRELDYICHKALEKDPCTRYQRATELAADLQRVLHGQPLDCPQPTLLRRLETWWRREPILVVHVCGIGLTTTIVLLSHILRDSQSPQFPARIFMLLTWLAASFVLQYWVDRARWRDVACLSWASLDVILYTTLIAFADPPRSMLLIGYPMMVVASSLFYRKRFVIFMTSVSIAGFIILRWLTPMDDFVRLDFAAIFVCGLAVISLTLLSMIRRVRSMSLFQDEG